MEFYLRNEFDTDQYIDQISDEQAINTYGKRYIFSDISNDTKGMTLEADMIHSLNGQVWHVKRGADPVWFRMYQDIGVEPKDVHESEWRWANVKFDSIIGNNGTMEDLKNQVQDHLASISRLASA